MGDENTLATLPQSHTMEIPAFGKSPSMKFDMINVRVAESRFGEAKDVSPITYSDLEYTLNESYRDLKRFLSSIGYQLAMAEKAKEEAKADVLLGSYAEAMRGKPKYQDNADLRQAYLSRDLAYEAAVTRIAQLKALESNFDGKLKVVENVCRAMRKKMDLIIRSGIPTGSLYNTQGRK
jgi:hypothetical protein